jgi:ABC-2 type transport system permease protein
LLPVSAHAAPSFGPSALGGSLRRFVELTVTLARTEFKLRYFGSALGYVWSLIRPLLFFGVIYVFFTQIIHVGRGIPHYGVYLLTGIVLWNYFSEATGNCVNCLVAREAILRKIRFPRMVVPLAVSLTAMFNLAMNFIVVLVFALVSGIAPAWSWLELLPIVLGFMVLATGIGMFLSVTYVRYRDVAPIWEVLSQVLFYATPIMYTATSYRGLEHIAMLSPLAVLMTQMGHAFIRDPYFVSAAHAAGSPLRLAIALALIPAVLAVGWLVFTREAPRVAENL